MPIDPDVKREALINLGYNPDEYDVDDNFQVFARETVTTPAPEVTRSSPEAVTAKSSSSATGALLRHAATGVPSAVTGLAVGAKAGQLMPGPWPVKLGASLVAGGAAAMGTDLMTRKGLEKVVPKFAMQLADDVREHPIMSTAGSVLSQLAGLKPDIKTALGAGNTLRNILRGARPSGDEVANLANVGIGGATGAGMSVGSDLASGEDISIPKALISGIGGAVINNPNALGRKFGLPANAVIPKQEFVPRAHATEEAIPRTEPERFKAQELEELDDAARAVLETPNSNEKKEALRARGGFDDADAIAATEKKAADKLAEEQKAEAKLQKQAKAVSDAQQRVALKELKVEEERVKVYEKELDETIKKTKLPAHPPLETKLDETGLDIKKAEADLAFDKAVTPEPVKVASQEPNSVIKMPAKAGELKTDSDAFKARSMPDVRYQEEPALARTKGDSEIEKAQLENQGFAIVNKNKKQYTPAIRTASGELFTAPSHEAIVKEAKGERGYVDASGKFVNLMDIARAEMRNTPAIRLPDGKVVTDPAAKKHTDLLRKVPINTLEHDFQKLEFGFRDSDGKFRMQEGTEVPRRPSDMWKEFFKKRGEELGVETKDANGLLLHPETGKEISGMAMLKDRIAKINTEKEGMDTRPHELFHIFVDDMLHGPSDSRRKLAQKAISALAKKEGITPTQAEERLTSLVGVDASRRAIKEENTFGATIRDIWSNIKVRFGGGKATQDDFARLFSTKLIHDAPDAKVPVVEGKPPALPKDETPTTDVKLQEEPEIPRDEIKYSTDPEVRAREVDSIGKQDVSVKMSMPINDAVLRSRSGKTKEATEIVPALRKATSLRGWYEGKYVNVPRETIGKYSPELQERVHQKLMDQDLSGKPATFSSDEKPVADYVRQLMVDVHDQQRALGLLVSGRAAKDNPVYFPSVMSREVQGILTQEPASIQARVHKKNIIEHWVKMGMTLPKATEQFDNYIRGLSRAIGNGSGQVEFKALREAEGLGLPKSVREQNLSVALQRYGSRVSRDLAFFEGIQSNPRAVKILGLQDQHGKTPDLPDVTSLGSVDEIKTAMRHMFGMTQVNERAVAVGRTVSNALLGPATGLRDIASVPVNVLPYLKAGEYGIFLKAFGKLKEARRKAFEAGTTRKNLQELTFGTDVTPESIDKVVNGFNRVANLLYRVQGRGVMENFAREYDFAIGDILARTRVAERDTGFMETFGDLLSADKQSFKTKLTEEDFSKIAKRFVDYAQQEYNANDLPAAALEGGAAPFLALARWSIGKSNTILKHVVTPLRDGNPMPFITYTLGTLLTGAGIQELNELINNKKDYNPTAKELWKADEKGWEDVAAGVINLMQLGSFAGVIGDTLKMGSDVVLQGQKPRGFSIPMVNMLSEVVGEDLANVSRALKDGGNPGQVWYDFALKFITDHVQGIRMIANHTLNAEKTSRAGKFRDKKVYEKLTNQEAFGESSEVAAHSNPFFRPSVKRFKRTGDLTEATELIPRLISEAITRSDGDPDRLKSELKSLKQNSYQTMPNPDNFPKEFLRFMQFLADTQGPEEASARLVDYFKQNEVNKAKTAMLP